MTLVRESEAATAETEPETEEEAVEPLTTQEPRAISGVLEVPERDRLPRVDAREKVQPSAWFIDAHSASGASSVAGFIPEAEAVHHWPTNTRVPAFLVARSNVKSLKKAQTALRDYGSGTIDTVLAGLVVVADAPGKTPREIRHLIRVLGGLVPRTVQVPWIEAFRFTEDFPDVEAPKELARLARSINHHNL